MKASVRRGRPTGPSSGERREGPQRQTFLSGPYKGVRTSSDPYDDTPDYLDDAAVLAPRKTVDLSPSHKEI